MPASPQWLFDRFRLDPDHACLWCEAQAIALPPKAFALLHYLVTHPDRLVPKDELLDAVWPETAVSDAVIRVAIGVLRKALDDTAQTPRFIATVSRRGYRFLAPVTVIDPPETGRAGAPLQRTEPVPPHQGAVPPAPDVLLPQEGADAWRCAMCQHLQSRTARFCVVCGAPHVEICRACGQAVPMPATFCPGCGQRLEALPAAEPPSHLGAALPLARPVPLPAAPRAPAGEHMLDAGPERAPLVYTPLALAEKIRTARAALEGERKQVTVLFADIKDSLELIRGLDPEVAQQLLDPALHAMMDAVHRYEGTVNQVLGDGIMALFGAPIAHEDHAARACYAALAMQAGLATYAEEVRRAHGVALQSRIGLNSGEVVVRTIRNDLHMDYSAVGQTTHLAARMEQVAPPDTILLTAATAQLVAGLVRLKAWGPVPIKGLAEPVEVWELLGSQWHASALADRPCPGPHPLCGAADGAGCPARGAGPGRGGARPGGSGGRRGGRGEVAAGGRVCPGRPHPGLVSARQRRGVLRPGHPLLPGPRPAAALLPLEEREDAPHHPGQGDGANTDARRRPPGHGSGTACVARRPASGQPVLAARPHAASPAHARCAEAGAAAPEPNTATAAGL